MDELARTSKTHINIAIINKSTELKDADCRKAVAALQIQVSRDFAAVYGTDAALAFYPHNLPIPAGYWQIALLDNSDQAGALGYHDVTNEGLPLAKVFAKTDAEYGLSWTVTTSHELLEMLADPDISTCVQVGNRFYAREVCDACEDDSYAYEIDGIKVSDFVFPAWFEPFNTHARFDYMNKITKPLQLLPGGYIGHLDITSTDGWQEETMQSVRPYDRLHKRGIIGKHYSRLHRRANHRDLIRSRS